MIGAVLVVIAAVLLKGAMVGATGNSLPGFNVIETEGDGKQPRALTQSTPIPGKNTGRPGATPTPSRRDGTPRDGMHPGLHRSDRILSSTLAADPLTSSGLTVADDVQTTTILGKQYLVGPDGKLIEVTGGPDELRPGELTPTPVDSDAAGNADDDLKPGNQRIAGNVSSGEKPVEGARLTLFGEGGGSRSTATDPTGDYRFAGIAPGRYTIVLDSPRAPAGHRAVLLTEGQDRDHEDFVIPTNPPVTGTVVSDSGAPVPDARLEVWLGNVVLGSGVSDAEGKFELFPLESGGYLLKGSATGFLPGEQPFEVPASGQSQPVRLKLIETKKIRGVVRGASGEPISGAYVALFGNSAFNDPYSALGGTSTDAKGAFEFSAPEAAGSAPFRAGAYREGLVPAYSATVAPQDAGKAPIEIRLLAGGTLRGMVVEIKDEHPAPVSTVDVTVQTGFPNTGAIFQRLNVPLPHQTTSQDGRFTLKGIEAGEISVRFAAEGYISADKTFTISDGITEAGNVVIESANGAKEGRLFGVVVDELGRPLVKHNVYVRSNTTQQGRTTQTDTRGGFLMDGLEAGGYLLVTNGSMLRGDLFVTMDQTLNNVQPGGEQLFISYDFGQGAKIRVLDQDGVAVKNFRVRATVRYSGGGAGGSLSGGMSYEQRFQTSDGRAVLDTLLPGTAEIIVTVDGFGAQTVPSARIPVAAIADLGDITIPAGTTVEGIAVSAQTGAALANVTVRAVRDGATGAGLNISTSTEVSGLFKLKGVPEGNVDITLARAGLVSRKLIAVQVKQGQANNAGEVRMDAAATLIGRVTSAAGAPLGSIQISVGGVLIFTDAEGRFSNDTLTPGRVTLNISDARGVYLPMSAAVDLTAGVTTVADQQMQAR
ncbi:hypothetical protein BH09SUM1_BH09SUM1_17690 [soil metagenome]